MSRPDCRDDVECMMCEEGILVEKGSKWENACGEDDSVTLVCNICGAAYNEMGQLLRVGDKRIAKAEHDRETREDR